MPLLEPGDFRLQVQLLLRLFAAEPAASPVRAGGEALGVATSPDDIAGRSLRAGDDPGLARPGPGGPFAVDQDLAAEMALQRRVVVGDVDGLGEKDRGAAALQDILDPLQHQAPVGPGEFDAVAHLLQVARGHRGIEKEKGQLPVDGLAAALFAADLDGQVVVVVGHLVAEIAAAGMDHDPDMAVVRLLDLDEVVAAAEGADLAQGMVELAADDGQRFDIAALHRSGHQPYVLPAAVVGEAGGDGQADRAEQ